jgi:3',5'-cyclic-AMP phosphodiesterase
MRTLAHLSDLHIGIPAHDRAAEDLCRALLEESIEHVVVTGDITHRGRKSELERFQRIFAPLHEQNRITLVPGNHDRWNDDVSSDIMSDRVDVIVGEGLYLVRADSSGPQNRTFFISHGSVDEQMIHDICVAFDRAPERNLRALLLHHHLLPQPEETAAERFAAFIGWPHVAELDLAGMLLTHLRGRCDLVLHGHRHVPHARILHQHDARPLHIYNAGSSTALGRVRVFHHAGGELLATPAWLDYSASGVNMYPTPRIVSR